LKNYIYNWGLFKKMIPNNSVLNNILLPPLYKSFYIGKVIDNNDESKTGKLKISIPELT